MYDCIDLTKKLIIRDIRSGVVAHLQMKWFVYLKSVIKRNRVVCYVYVVSTADMKFYGYWSKLNLRFVFKIRLNYWLLARLKYPALLLYKTFQLITSFKKIQTNWMVKQSTV